MSLRIGPKVMLPDLKRWQRQKRLTECDEQLERITPRVAVALA
jgi:hypothetical protein